MTDSKKKATISNKKGLTDATYQYKRVLIRVDFNVPLHKETGKPTNLTRVKEALPTIKFVIEKGAKCVVLMSHLGRPDGQKKPKESLSVLVEPIQELLGKNVTFLDDCVGDKVLAAVNAGKDGQVFLLENLRFHIEEEGRGVDKEGKEVKASEADVAKFREELTKLGDVFVNDAFGTAHRAHSSMVGVKLNERVAGFLMKKELDFFGKALENPSKPFLAILGGAKVSDKIKLIQNLLDKVDEMIIGGGMAYTFEKMMHGTNIGKSLFDEKGSAIVKDIVEKAKAKGVQLHFPTDWIVADKFAKDANHKIASRADGIPEGWMGLDIGPETRKSFAEVIKRGKTVVWNGPMGVFEFPAFAEGTRQLMNTLVEITPHATTIVGGGDTATCAAEFGVDTKVGHTSTGGGASLELLEGRDLPGVTYLSDK